MEFVIVGLLALAASVAVFYSGFGLGAVALPVFALFFPLEVAIAAAAVVHGAHNGIQVLFQGPAVDRDLIKRFGFPAGAAALLGACLLVILSGMRQLAIYPFGQMTAVVTPLKLIIAALILIFTVFEFLPHGKSFRIPKRHLTLGALLSGFFGGLSGHQCALRSAFLVKNGLSKEVFHQTNASISLLVDACRLLIYTLGLAWFAGSMAYFTIHQWLLMLTGVGAALGGILAGQQFIRPVQIPFVRYLTGGVLFLVAIGLGMGWI